MFPPSSSSSFTSKPSLRSTSIIGGLGSSGNCGLLVGSTVSNKTVANDEYEDMMKKLSHEIESTSQSICELQIRRQQLLEQLDDVKKAYHKVLESRSEWRFALDFGKEGNEIGQLCRPWGVAIVRMPPSLLAHYTNENIQNLNSANGHPASSSTSTCTGLLSCSSSNLCNSHSNLNNFNNLKQESNVTVGSSRPGLSSSLNTNAINTGNSSSIHPFLQQQDKIKNNGNTNTNNNNATSASGSSSSSSSWELDFSVLAQYYLKLNDDALFQPFDPFSSPPNDNGTNSCQPSYTSINAIDEKNTGISSSMNNSGNSVTPGATITGISSHHSQAPHSARASYGSESVNINPSSTLTAYGSKQYFSTSLSSSSSYHNCDSSPSSSSSTHNSISTNPKNTITGNLSSYATILQENLNNANGSPSPSSHWDTNHLLNSCHDNPNSGFHLNNTNNSNCNNHNVNANNLNGRSSNTYSSGNPNPLINGGNRNIYKAVNNPNGNQSANSAVGSSSNAVSKLNNVNADHKHYLIAIADRSNNRIQLLHFDATAITVKVIHVFGSGPGTRAGLFDRPAGITINTGMNHIIVADKDNHRIQIFDLKGRFQFKFGEKGNRVGQFCYPWDVDSCQSTHHLLVSDTRNRRVQLFTAYGQYITHFIHPLDSPRGVSFFGDSKIVVSDFNKHRLIIFDKYQGKEDASKIIGFGEGTGWGQFLRPQGISISGNYVFCADSRNNRICIYNSLTNGFEYLSQDLNCDRPSGLHVIDNILVVVDFGNNRLQICLRC